MSEFFVIDRVTLDGTIRKIDSEVKPGYGGKGHLPYVPDPVRRGVKHRLNKEAFRDRTAAIKAGQKKLTDRIRQSEGYIANLREKLDRITCQPD